MKVHSVAPSRISLFGGGTDLPEYVAQKGGLVISFAINLYQKLTLFSDSDLYEHPYFEIPPLGKKEFYYTILEEFGLNDMHRTSLTSEFDGLLESGLGSSAAAACALIGAINKQQDLKMTPTQIAEKAWDIEVNKFGLYGGRQDQYASVYGGFNVIQFEDKVTVTPLARGLLEPLIPAMVLLYTGQNRKSAKIQEGFKSLTQKQIQALDAAKVLVLRAVNYVAEGNYEQVGFLLHEGWELKKASNKGVTNERLDSIYDKALLFGAYGGKVLGAGGGGFMLFMVDPRIRKSFVRDMKKHCKCEEYDFEIAYTGLETRRLP